MPFLHFWRGNTSHPGLCAGWQLTLMDDGQFRKLLDQLGYSWKGYRKVRRGVKKRLRRHMQELECRDVETYLQMMVHREDVRDECELRMLVSISRFFRDRRLWQLLEHEWLPDLMARNPAVMRVWSAGCACGEEVYSFKIVWERLKAGFESMPALQVLATDRHPRHLERARSGIYRLSSLKQIPPDERIAFFESHKGGRQFRINAILKKDVRWELGHLLRKLPGSDFNLIFLRNNVLTYYHPKIRETAFARILSCLAPGGLLFIGCHETIPVEPAELIPLGPLPYAFRKKE